MTELKKMWDFCPDPSDAVRAMVSGLRTARGKKNFFLAMKYYAHVESLGEEEICYGCASTCAILESLALWPRMMEYAASRGKNSVAEDAAELERVAGVDWDDLRKFEVGINALQRSCDVEQLCEYYEVDIWKYANFPKVPYLTDSYSEAELQKHEAFADALETAGL